MKKELSAREFLEKSRNRCDVLADFNRCSECKAYRKNHLCTLCSDAGLLEENEVDEVIKQIEEWGVTEPKEPQKEKTKDKKEKLKDVLIVIFAITVTIAIFSFFAIMGLDLKKKDFDYSAKGVMKDNQTVITEDGNIWKYDTNYKKDTKVVVKFHTNGTSSIKDDIITEIKKITP